ncbi:MAG: hypothetical protein GY805_17780 [Chloroflexi bacterium]|nr:hypothetical protein [Chloroflexota bacterium]
MVWGPLSPLDYADDKANLLLSTAGEFPQKTADNLLRYDKTHGMFDVTYAAAWDWDGCWR